ncbi:AAA domain-containing protein [Meloidogyne graminicola]|uniref:AAA domain-containing protein n=1 Tax=Meloidogyne graminicola TaxID=189291 RepID=A0A8S9ZX03_9BILA|nr:AAA domain-containing protein [Meloidogyne graminicola]
MFTGFEDFHFSTNVNGGLVIKKMARLQIDDVHYSLFKHKFDMVEVRKNIDPLIFEHAASLKVLLDTKFPQGMNEYAGKFKAYNHISLIFDMIQQLRNKDGPHSVFHVTLPNGNASAAVFELQLGEDFCERFNVPNYGVLKLELATNSTRGPAREIKCKILKFDEVTRKVRFTPLSLQALPRGKFYVRFEPSRFVYNARHHILQNVYRLQETTSFLIFPKPFDDDFLSLDRYIEKRDNMIKNIRFSSDRFNKEQRNAIFAILMSRHIKINNCDGALLPYIIHGPPGTGKTTILVEAVRLLIEQKNVENKVIVCTPSNTAADLFATELLETAKIDPNLIFRLYALMVPVDDLKESLKPVTFVKSPDLNSDADMFAIYPAARLAQFRVIVCTMIASTYLMLGGLATKFTHIIIDEAGQASELETLVPIVGLIGDGTKVILAGDHKQLGPVEAVDYFRRNKFNNSLLERLQTIEFYKDDERVMTFLRKNYRSHEAIIAVPSRLCYNNELIAAEDALPRDKLANWEGLPSKGFPILWHHIESPEKCEENGTSYMNSGELELVITYVKRIITELQVKPIDIGIISPYTYQARKLRHSLMSYIADITIDTVERFQGSQRRVIIVTTVRCNPNDKLGFMHSKKRFNTTIARAEELLIIVGNAKIMTKVSSWASMYEHCHQNNAIIGVSEELSKEILASVQLLKEKSIDDDEEGAEQQAKTDSFPKKKYTKEELKEMEVGVSSSSGEDTDEYSTTDTESSTTSEEEDEDSEEEEDDDFASIEDGPVGGNMRTKASDDEEEEELIETTYEKNLDEAVDQEVYDCVNTVLDQM